MQAQCWTQQEPPLRHPSTGSRRRRLRSSCDSIETEKLASQLIRMILLLWNWRLRRLLLKRQHRHNSMESLPLQPFPQTRVGELEVLDLQQA